MDIKIYDEMFLFNELMESRKELVNHLVKNNMYEGFKNLLTQLYPDNAHYIFELIQNAEDASKNNVKRATVRFILTNDYLEFEHNGERLFDIKDVNSITTIGDSTKIDDKTNIGKFGIGFKSVFAITDTPEIISGKFHFYIKDMFIPVPKNNQQTGYNNILSRFIFPFNNPKKNKFSAVEEIKKELLQLGSETLLFLKNIEMIKYVLPDGESLGYMKKEESDKNILTINIKIPNEEERIYYWLRYVKKITVNDNDGNAIPCSIAIAFKQEKIARFNKNLNEGSIYWKIKAEDNGKVCIYFPAEDENSRLHFNIHAPFASTVARNSVRKEDCKENEILRDEIAVLISDSLFDIKKRNLLTVDFFGVLPVKEDGLSLFYEPIRLKIISTFKENPLVPTKNGDFSTATKLFRCPKRVSGGLRIDEVIDDNDLSFLIDLPIPLWAKNANPNNPREDQFLDSLEINEWGKKELTDILNPKNEDERNKIEEWIGNKPNHWLLIFYALLENLDICKDAMDKSLKLIKLIKNNYVSISEKLYFVPENEDNLPDNINFIECNLFNEYEGKEADRRKNDARKFLMKMGVEEYTENEKIKLHLKEIANKYSVSDPNVTYEQHLNDIKEFCKYKYSKELLQGKYFILNILDKFCTANYVCTQVISTLIEQAELTTEYNKICINNLYDQLTVDIKEKFLILINELGVMYKLNVIVEENYFSRDYIIKGIDKIILLLKSSQYKKIFAELLWNAIQECTDRGAQNRYSQPDGRCTYTYGFRKYNEQSSVLKKLYNFEWVPDKNGNFYKPQDITKDMLPTNYIINEKSTLFKAFDLGKNKLSEQFDLEKRSAAAEILGLNPEVIESLITAGIDINNFLYELNNSKQNIFQDETDEIFDPDDKYEDEPFTKEKIKDARIIHEYIERQFKDEYTLKINIEIRPRSIRTSRNIAKEHASINNRYHGYCQICKERKPNWDITELIKVRQREIFSKKPFKELKEFEQLNLSLCLYCAREYRRIRENDESMESFLRDILNTNPKERNDVIIKGKSIWFTNTHLEEIRKILTLECNDIILNN